MPCGDGPSGNPKPKQHRLEVPFLRSAPFSECLPGITQDDETRGGRIAGCLLWRCKPRRKERDPPAPALDHCLQLFAKVVGEVGFELYYVRLQILPLPPCSEASVFIPSITTNAGVSGI